MNQREKNLKLSCIACLFVGLFGLVAGIVAAVAALDVDAMATIAGGVVGLPVGVKASRMANVPSNAGKIRTISLIVTVGAIAFAGVAFAMGDPTPLQMAALAAAVVVGLLMTLFSHTLVKEQERV